MSKPTQDEINAIFTRYLEDLMQGLCPICKQKVTKRQVGRCVYGSCGHRLYQGKVTAFQEERNEAK